MIRVKCVAIYFVKVGLDGTTFTITSAVESAPASVRTVARSVYFEAARKLPGQTTQIPAAISSGSDLDFRPTQIRNQNDRIESQHAQVESDLQDNTDELPMYRQDQYRWSVERDLPIYRQDLYRWSEED